ncbi:Phosphoribosyl pyrophosphate synthase-associated protein 2 [Cichlidogyrus casuarinus]|uniref:ribose-phosphate diphosphokinase n=1 Tax=Cichlidogyrus casuarinus TaxID=1844966 RepID=A0ABD2PLB6_9PLAT
MLARPKANKYIVLSGNSHKELARLVCSHLDSREGDCKLFYKSNLETHVIINDSVRGCNVFIIQTGSQDVNRDIMEACILSYGCKSSSCETVTLVMPYLAYSRHCRRNGRSAIECQLVARMFAQSGVDKLLTVDLFADEIQGFFEIPVENLRASAPMIRHIKLNFRNLANSVVVALDARSAHRASYFAAELDLPMAIIHCRNRILEVSPDAELTKSDGSVVASQSTRQYHLVGEVKEKDVIVVSNMVDDSERITEVAKLLHRKAAKTIVAIATHGLLCDQKMQEIQASHINQLILTNSIPLQELESKYSKLCVLDLSPLLAEAIRRIHNQESMYGLFSDTDFAKTEEDDD